jgi:hypothetical protein
MTYSKVNVFVGTCGAGKTYYLKSMFSDCVEKNNFKDGLCFSHIDKKEYEWLDPHYVKQTFDEEVLKTFVENVIDKNREDRSHWKPPHRFLIIDDQLGALSESKTFLQLLGFHRTINMSIFIVTQDRKTLHLLRNFTDNAFMWPCALKHDTKALYKSFGGMFDNLKQFEEALDTCRETPYACLKFENNPQFETVVKAYNIVTASNVA